MRERLKMMIAEANVEWLNKTYDHETDKTLAEYTTDILLANGVIVPPCRVGDVVKAREVFYKVYSVAYQDRDDFKKPNWRFHASPLSDDIDIDDIYFWLEEIEEETVCVCTREEAEKALKEVQG